MIRLVKTSIRHKEAHSLRCRADAPASILQQQLFSLCVAPAAHMCAISTWHPPVVTRSTLSMNKLRSGGTAGHSCVLRVLCGTHSQALAYTGQACTSQVAGFACSISWVDALLCLVVLVLVHGCGWASACHFTLLAQAACTPAFAVQGVHMPAWGESHTAWHHISSWGLRHSCRQAGQQVGSSCLYSHSRTSRQQRYSSLLTTVNGLTWLQKA
jgi:hypothetical protein